MDIILGSLGQVVVDNVADPIDIDTTSEHVSGDKHPDLGLGKLLQGFLPLVLRPTRMDDIRLEPRLPDAPTCSVCAISRTGKHDDTVSPVLLEHSREAGRLCRMRDMDDILLDGVRRFSLSGHLHKLRFPHHALGDAANFLVDGGGEQQGLTFGVRRRDDSVDRGQKPHVKHTVRLIEHQRGDKREVRDILADEILKAARCRDEHVATAPQPFNLGAVGNATDHRQHRVLRAFCHGLANPTDLFRELTGGSDDEHRRASTLARGLQLVKARQRERGRLARTGLRRHNDVAPLQHQGNGLLLDRGRLFIAQVAHRLQCGATKA